MSRPVTVTALEQAQVDTSQSKFGGASALFDGVNDRLSVSGVSSTATSGAFTLEAWTRFNILPSSNGGGWMMLVTVAFSTYILVSNTSIQLTDSGQYMTFSDANFVTDTWYHIAVTRNASNEYDVWVDGVALTRPSAFTRGGNLFDTGFTIGRFTDVRGSWNGHIDEFRISSTNRYTSAFTSPTAPFTNDNDTAMLLHCDGTDASTTFLDDNGVNRSRVGVTAVGNAQVDTAQSKFGGASALFDGTGDRLVINDKSFHLKDEDSSTIEMWVYPTNNDGFRTLYSSNWYTPPNAYFLMAIANGNVIVQLSSDGQNSVNLYGSQVSLNSWNHIALTSDGNGKYEIFLNGQFNATATGVTIKSGTVGDPIIGSMNDGANSFFGSIDEVRVSNIVRYASAFTPDTQAFTNDADTLLLLHMDGTDGSTTFTDDNSAGEVKEGNAQFTTTSTATTEALRLRDVNAAFTTTSTATTDALRIRDVDAQFTSIISTSVAALRIRQTDAALSAQVTTNVTAIRVREFNANVTSAFSPSITAAVQKTVDVNILVVTQMFTDETRIRDSSATLLNIANLNAQAQRLVLAESSLEVLFDITAASQRTRTVDAAFSSRVDLVADYAIVHNAVVPMQSDSTLDADNTRFRSTAVIIEAIVSLTAQAQSLAIASADLQSEFSLFARAEKVFAPTALLVTASIQTDPSVVKGYASVFAVAVDSSFSMVVNGRILFVDDIVYTVPKEIRAYQIIYENR